MWLDKATSNTNNRHWLNSKNNDKTVIDANILKKNKRFLPHVVYINLPPTPKGGGRVDAWMDQPKDNMKGPKSRELRWS